MSKPKVIAFYLPQYHPTPDNDKWWGKGFTEWTNVGKAKPLFHNHYQPRVPADLGYYDLRLPEVREAQAELAKGAGVTGFCYYHYWFGNGKQELELPFNEVLKSGKPDFPFMLCWANESWHSKFWNIDGTVKKKLLIEQTYPGDDDIIKHFSSLLAAFKDPRYIKVNNKPVFMIYQPFQMPDCSKFISTWNKLAKDNGFDGIYFIAHLNVYVNSENIDKLLSIGFDGVNDVRLNDASSKNHRIGRFFRYLKQKILHQPHIISYNKICNEFIGPEDSRGNVFPTIIPNWDHSPRSKRGGLVLTNSTPDNFKKHLSNVFSIVSKKKCHPNFVFIKSWNEWGEGNYMEPDLKFGKGYLKALRDTLDGFSSR